MAQAAKGAAAAAAGAGAEGKSSVAHLPHDAKERWTVVYPAYINKKLKESEGRKIGLNDAVENPTVQEIADICSYLKLPHVIEVRGTDVEEERRIFLFCFVVRASCSSLLDVVWVSHVHDGSLTARAAFARALVYRAYF